MRVWSENERQLAGKQQLCEVQKEQEQHAYQDFKWLVDTDQARRDKEREERQNKIKALLNRQSILTVEQQAA